MVGWLAVPVIGSNGQVVGMLQLTSKMEGDFTEDDESKLVNFSKTVSLAFETYYDNTAYLRQE